MKYSISTGFGRFRFHPLQLRLCFSFIAFTFCSQQVRNDVLWRQPYDRYCIVVIYSVLLIFAVPFGRPQKRPYDFLPCVAQVTDA